MLPVAADGTCRAPESSAKTNRMKQHAKKSDRLLPAAVPPVPGERPVVGRRIHGVAQRGEGTAALSGGITSPTCRPISGSTTCVCPEVRQQQAALAERYGLSGFCYYHYWFNGHRLMQRPVEEMLASGKPDFPFMLCWANENWTRAWDGGEQGGTDPAGVLRGGRPRAHPLSARRGIPRSALHPCRRKAGLRRLPFGALSRHPAHDRGCGARRPARGVELYLCRVEKFQRRRTRRAGGRIRRCDRVPAPSLLR